METHVFSPENFIAGDFPIITEREKIASGLVLPRHSALGKVSATGELKNLDSAATDGSQIPYAILIDAVDTTDGATNADVFKTGEFNADKVVFKAGEDANQHKDAFRKISIFLKKAHKE